MTRKLIEVALPLEQINAAAKADKDRKTGTIRNLHKWFAPAPLPAWRALLFAALVDDPVDDNRRVYLLDLIKRLVAKGADLPDPDTLDEARKVIAAQFPDGVPTVMDPFCGGGSTLVEAQRLGLPTYGSDLNPVPVLITRTLTELLPKVYGQQPLHPETFADRAQGKKGSKAQLQLDSGDTHVTYIGYDGLIRDVTYYAELIRDQAWAQLKDYYPAQPDETPIAWLWARTVTCPNPACGIETVLTTSWWLSKKKGDLAWIEPKVVDGKVVLNVISEQTTGEPPASAKVGRGTFACIACAAPLDEVYLRKEGTAGRMGTRMTAVVAEHQGKRIYRSANDTDFPNLPEHAHGDVFADVPINVKGAGIRVGLYGMETWEKLYTPRQLLTLTTFANLVATTHDRVLEDRGTKEWADAVSSLLGLALGKLAGADSTQTRWKIDSRSGGGKVEGAFGRNDLPMTWDFGEPAVLEKVAGGWMQSVVTAQASVSMAASGKSGITRRADARVEGGKSHSLVATDPPYFDAIGYADLSDYFYIWHRRALKTVHPDLYGTMAAPKVGELTAIPSHHGDSVGAAREYFIEGFADTFRNLQTSLLPGLPMLVIYASKEQKAGSGEETRWESILTAMIDAGLEITGTWPIHMTGASRMRGIGANAVAAYIVLVCRPRPADATTCSLNDFARALRRELPGAIADLQDASILPVDLYQSALGPGMQIYSRYRRVEDSSGERVPVGRALEMISKAVAEVLDEQEGNLDAASRFAVAFWDRHGWNDGPFGEADQIARQLGTHVDDIVRSGVAIAGAGKVRLLGTGDLDRTWSVTTDNTPTAWEAVHHLADRLISGGGATEAAELLATLGDFQDSTRALAYRLHDIAAKKGWTADQERYNALIGQWNDLLALAATHRPKGLF